jgi:hypothetical protein
MVLSGSWLVQFVKGHPLGFAYEGLHRCSCAFIKGTERFGLLSTGTVVRPLLLQDPDNLLFAERPARHSSDALFDPVPEGARCRLDATHVLGLALSCLGPRILEWRKARD